MTVLALIASAWMAAAPGPPPAAPAAPEPIPSGIVERITQAESAFRVQNYPRVVELLDTLVGHPKLEGKPEHVKVLEWLGAAHWFTGARDAARLVFGQLLKESPFHVLDAFVYPDALIEFYEARRRELILANIIPGKPDGDGDGPREILIRTIATNETPAIAYLAPFGVGQFANDEAGKGLAFAVLEGVGSVAMLAGWIGIEGLKQGDTNGVREADRKQAELFDTLWVVGAGVFVASWTASVVDGFVNRRTTPVIEERVERLKPKAPEPEPRVILGPGPGDLGVSVGVGF